MSERAARFWANVVRGPSDRCWEWRGSRMNKGYGQTEFRVAGKRTVVLAHRLSWEVHFGSPPPDLFVCHRCDNPPCVNPAHLFLGTNRDNIRDAMAKGRVPQLTDANAKVRGANHPLRKDPSRAVRGERNGLSKLTAEQVMQIRRTYAGGSWSLADIAKEYGVTQDAIWRIVQGKNWRHLPVLGLRSREESYAGRAERTKRLHGDDFFAKNARRAVAARMARKSRPSEATGPLLRELGLIA